MSDPDPSTDSSNFALGRLRALLDDSAFDGERLPSERVLATRLGIGRRALRRALEVLEAEGRIWRHQGKGTFLGPRPAQAQTNLEELTKRTHPLEVMDVRLEIEPALARLAAMRATNGDIERLMRLADRTATSYDADGRELWDSALHRTIAEAAGNSLLLAIFDMVDRIRQDTTWQLLRERARSSERQKIYVEQHRRVIAAIAQREASAAEHAMREHLELVREGLLKVMTRPLPDRTDEQIQADPVPQNNKDRLRHGT
ncbi:DNA-binding FadR family transcriptional regulator [Microvirga flocculans]|uniref:DNA-binding FadR family transcriptional regulator n=1 Tax=Microvirga flocculans TaxID=217168 RepID=A0A7W6N9Q6_9HYPH|nr:FCD domain-containing protein [Microvirga flocculans]MBB4041733.1 DNA-binding FadR family transcriptional regulator [Microvirga flocculans]